MTDVAYGDTNVTVQSIPGSASFLPQNEDWARSADVAFKPDRALRTR